MFFLFLFPFLRFEEPIGFECDQIVQQFDGVRRQQNENHGSLNNENEQHEPTANQKSQKYNLDFSR